MRQDADEAESSKLGKEGSCHRSKGGREVPEAPRRREGDPEGDEEEGLQVERRQVESHVRVEEAAGGQGTSLSEGRCPLSPDAKSDEEESESEEKEDAPPRGVEWGSDGEEEPDESEKESEDEESQSEEEKSQTEDSEFKSEEEEEYPPDDE